MATRSAFSRAAESSDAVVGLVLPVGFGDDGVNLSVGALLDTGVESVTVADPDSVDGGGATDGVAVLSGAPDVVAPPAARDVHPARVKVRAAPHSAIRHRPSACLVTSTSLPRSGGWWCGGSTLVTHRQSLIVVMTPSQAAVSTAWSLDEDSAVFADVELVVGGGVEGGSAGDAGVGCPGDGPVGGRGDGPGAGAASAFFQ